MEHKGTAGMGALDTRRKELILQSKFMGVVGVVTVGLLVRFGDTKLMHHYLLKQAWRRFHPIV